MAATQQLDRIIASLHNELQIQETYHDHKEKMAWTSTYAFLGFTVLFIGKLGTMRCTDLPDLFNARLDPFEWIMFTILSVMFLLTLAFTSMQFKARWHSAAVTEAIYRHLFRLELELDVPKSTLHWPVLNKVGQTYPDEIQQEIRLFESKRTISSILAAVPLLFSAKTDERLKTEIPSYGMALVLFLAQVLTVIWLNYK